MNVQRIDLQRIPDPRGNLSVVEQLRDVPFEIARAFLMYDVPGGEIRGGHAYKQSQEFIIALSGSFDVVTDNGRQKETHSLNRSYYGLYVPNGVWRHMENFSTNALALVLSSTHYDEADYLYDYADYLEWLKKEALASNRLPGSQAKAPLEAKPPLDKDPISIPQGRRFLELVTLMDLPRIEFREGNITPLEGWRPSEEGDSLVPFDIKRVFYIYDIPGGESRGAHAHKRCHQLIIAASGSFNVVLDNGHEQATVTLNRPYQALHVPPGIWCHEADFCSGSVCLVLTSEPFDEADYIRDYQDYLASRVSTTDMDPKKDLQKDLHKDLQKAFHKKPDRSPHKEAILFYDLQRLTNRHGDAIKEAVGRVIDKGWFLLGQEVATFERHYAAYIGTKHCIGVANGLDALRIILRAYKELGQLQDGDDVLVPANTYIATILAITDNRLNPVLVEPNPLTLQLDETRLYGALTSRTKAVMIVHLYGQNAWTETIATFCDNHGLLLLEDNAQAAGCVVTVPTTSNPGTPGTTSTPGTTDTSDTPGTSKTSPFSRQKTGSLGHAAGHSFYPTKPLGALGDGGAVTTNDDQLATIIRSLANYGSSRKYVFPYQGYNSRLDEVQAATLDLKLRHLDSENERRRSIARQFSQGLNHPFVELPGLSLNDDNVFHLFPILVKGDTPISAPPISAPPISDTPISAPPISDTTTAYPTTVAASAGGNNVQSSSAFRDALQQHLTNQGIQTQIHYPIPPHKQACYKTWNDRCYPITEAIHDCELSLPISPVMTDDEVQRVIDAVNRWVPNDKK